MHKNSKSYKTKVAALKKARAALKHKQRMAKLAYVRDSEISPAAAIAGRLMFEESMAPRVTSSAYLSSAISKSGKLEPLGQNLSAMIRERVRKLVLSELDALLA